MLTAPHASEFEIEGTTPEQNQGRANPKKYAKYAIAVVILLALAACVYMDYDNVKAAILHVRNRLQSFGLGTIPIIVVLCWVVTAVSGPAVLLEVFAGALFQSMYGVKKGALIGIPTCCLGIWLGCITAFALGRKYLKPKVEKIINERETLRVVNEIISQDGLKFAFLIRLNPLIPFELLNYAVAMSNITFATNAVAALGTMPVVSFEVYSSISAAALASHAAGRGKKEDSGEEVKEVCIKLAISVVLILVVMAYGKKKFDERIKERANIQLSENMYSDA